MLRAFGQTSAPPQCEPQTKRRLLGKPRYRGSYRSDFAEPRAPMTKQLPDSGQIFLDHVAHFVPAIDAAAKALELCGFRLTPFTAQTDQIGDKSVPAGTGNRCAM